MQFGYFENVDVVFFLVALINFVQPIFDSMASIFKTLLTKKKVASEILDVADANFVKILTD